MHPFYAGRPVLQPSKVVPQVQDPAREAGHLATDLRHAVPHLMEPCVVHHAGRHGSVGVDASHSAPTARSYDDGVLLAASSGLVHIRPAVLRVALVTSPREVPVPHYPRRASPLPCSLLVDHPVPASLGAHYRGLPDHHQHLVLQLPLSHYLELHAPVYHYQVRKHL